ncbi:hypothetical protein DRO26_04140 [Candidatus Bathyarchaeota archaeon]|nr:MAG: hypothetical protein DRO26_04140 [Candidatus Bathyarchaeota archaeon]
MRTVGPYSQYRYVEAVIFLEKDNMGNIRSPTLNPEYGWPVKTLDETDYETLRLSGKLEIGYLRSGEFATKKTVGIDLGNIPRMMAIVGQIGSGKTNAELVLNSSIMFTNGEAVGLIFDFAGELLTGKEIGKGLADHPFAQENLVYYGIEKPERKIPYGLIQIGLKKLTPKDLWFLLPEFTYPQEHYAEKLYRRIASPDWIIKTIEAYKEEDVDGVTKIAQTRQKSVVEAFLRKLLSLNEKIFTDVDYDFTHQVVEALTNGKTVLVDISGLREETQKQIVGWVVSRVVNHYRELWRKDFESWRRLPYLLITIEEAHKFLEEKGTIFSDVALTYRKYKVGLNAVTPRPSGINRDIFAELWTKIILKTTLKEDRVYLSENTPYLEYSDTELKMLDVGEALLVSQPKIHFAVPIKIFDYKEFLDLHEDTRKTKKPNLTTIKRSKIEENVI